jgi:tRNA 2-thiouridine synthesizing protein A
MAPNKLLPHPIAASTRGISLATNLGPTMTETLHIDVRGETCPVPLVEARKALLRAPRVEIVGDHDSSFKEIPLLAKNVGARVVEREGDEHAWRFVLERGVSA